MTTAKTAPKLTKKPTAAGLAGLPAWVKPYKQPVGEGLHLAVSTEGTKTWNWKYRFAGKERRLGFGRFPDIGLAEARERMAEARKLLRAGRDPGAERHVKSAAAPGDRTFEAVARDWYKRQRPQDWAPNYAADVIGRLEEHVFPILGRMDIGAITGRHVLQCLREIEERGTVDRAHRIRATVEWIFTYAIAAELCDNNPAAGLKRALEKNTHDKMPAIIELEPLVAMLRELDHMEVNPMAKAGLRFVALTAARPGMVRGMTWDEVAGWNTRNDPTWVVPAARMKMKPEYESPLSGAAVDVLRAMHPLTGTSRYVFPLSRDLTRPMNHNAMTRLIKDAGYLDEHVPHGFRASFSTIMNLRQPADRDAIEAQLAHRKRGVEGAYNRADYLEHRRRLLEEWASLIMVGAADMQAMMRISSSRPRAVAA